MSKGVLPSKILSHSYVPINLSTENHDLIGSEVYKSPQAFDTYIKRFLAKYNGVVAYGGYAEVRDLYRSSKIFEGTESETVRNIHLGIDFWCPEGTLIHTPLDGVVHSFANNISKGDYGPTIIMKHSINGTTFYTLYGHLSMDTIAMLKVGKPFLAGSIIGRLGDHSINGGYAPHLHFQIIKDLEGYEGDYPGVSAKKNLGSFLKNCPDPLLLIPI